MVDSELLIFDLQLHSTILAALARWTGVGRERVWPTPRSEAGKSYGIGGALSSRLLHLDVMQGADKSKRKLLVRELSKKEAIVVFIRGP